MHRKHTWWIILSAIKGMDKFEVGALIVATIGVVGGSVALYVLFSLQDDERLLK